MATNDSAPRRFRAGDVIEEQRKVIEALTTRSGRGDVLVEFTRNAKGETQVSVKVAAPHDVDPAELTTHTEHVYATAVKLYEDACAKFPTGSGRVRNEGQS